MNTQLTQSVGLPGALIIGLGSILGTGVYVSVGLSYQLAGGALLSAIVLAALVAIFNGLSAAQLAVSHPVSGGTYEYGYHFLSPQLGFIAGTLFVVAKSASAATAALAVSWAVSGWLDLGAWSAKLIACGLLVAIAGLVLQGVKRSNWLNTLLVALSLAGLAVFVWAGFTAPSRASLATALPSLSLTSAGLAEGAALMFVAFTGYGRIATMGEEVKDPARTIPRAIIITLGTTALLYILVGAALLQLAPPGAIEAGSFNLSQVVSGSPAPQIIALCAVGAMTGVVLNLVLGVSRVVLAMGRRGDLPALAGQLNSSHNSAPPATWLTCIIMVLIVLLADIEKAWTLSAFTVLVYYGITNLAALKVPAGQRFIPHWISIAGLISCLGLSLFVPTLLLAAGLAAILVLYIGHKLANHRR
ncbi:amino acid permease [Salinimonas marina]|uniref:Amino acid permease n=1 Tax=Salinimonas marina TaxID=2785918 RepID=A0A7S9HDK1_9ALTE|nr:APC family permease [Salinimonas marina]QPG06351.1 amino acid permease [Salinimonas marina]